MARKQKKVKQQAEAIFQAGCGRKQSGAADLLELAYTELAYPECPECPHRLEPEDADDFCVWQKLGRPHPFASLASLELEGERL